MEIQMSDFTLAPSPPHRQPWEDLRTYQAPLAQGDVKAIISFRWYPGERHQYQFDQWLYPPGSGSHGILDTFCAARTQHEVSFLRYLGAFVPDNLSILAGIRRFRTSWPHDGAPGQVIWPGLTLMIFLG